MFQLLFDDHLSLLLMSVMFVISGIPTYNASVPRNAVKMLSEEPYSTSVCYMLISNLSIGGNYDGSEGRHLTQF